jgi:hypothetical protein
MSLRIIVVNSNTTLVTNVIGGCYGNSGDGGRATSACVSYADGIWIDSNSEFYFTQKSFNRVRKVAASNIISSFAGNGHFSFTGDGNQARSAQLDSPSGTFVDKSGNVYIADKRNCRVRQVDSAGIISTIGGTDSCVSGGDGSPFSQSSLGDPASIWKDTGGNLYISEYYKIRKVAAETNIVITIAGGGSSSEENITATSYSFRNVHGIWGDTVNNIFVAENYGQKVKKLSLSSSLVNTVAGTGASGFLDNVPATSGKLSYPDGIWVDTIGRLFIADELNCRIRKVENGFISTFAGTGNTIFNGDGHLATLTAISFPTGVFGDSNGNIYVTDTYHARIRKVYAVNSTAIIVKTIIGSGSNTVMRGSFHATAASLSYPQHVAVDTSGNLYVTENDYTNAVRKTVVVASPTSQPSRQPTGQPTKQPFAHPTAQPSRQPTSQPTAQPKNAPTGQPSRQPTFQPSSRPSRIPSSLPSGQPTNSPSSLPTNQPISSPSSQPTSQPTKNRLHCTVADNKFYSPIRDDCVPCPLNSFLNRTGDDTCYCNGGYSQVGRDLILNCTICSPGDVSLPGSANCTQCLSGTFANSETHICEPCGLSFYSSAPGQIQCTHCPAGRATATLGSTSLEQCISPVPNFTLGFFALFLVVVIFSWYIVFGKFLRVSFERKVKIVTPNIEKCKEVLLSEEEFHYQHLIVVQDKKNQRTRKFKFFSFTILSIIVLIVSVFFGYVYFTYQVFFTSLILWRGLKVDLNLSPILTLLAEGLKDITDSISMPVDLFYFMALPFLYLFETLATIDLNLSSVNVTCAGSQAPIELLINCFILGLLIIIIRSDYQLLFNILLNNLNQRFLLNNVEQRLDAGNFRFSRYFILCLIVTAFTSINPFQVGLRYCMGFVRIDTFGKSHGVAHKVTESCNQVPGAPYFDSFLGYMSTIFAWWLILPAVYCLAEVVVPRCRKIDPLKKQLSQKKRSKKSASKIFPADLFVDESVKPFHSGKSSSGDAGDKPQEEEADEFEENDHDIFPDQEEAARPPELPIHLSTKFPGVEEAILADIFKDAYHEGYKGRVEVEKKRQQSNNIEASTDLSNQASMFRKSIQKVTKRMPFVLAFYYYCKQKYLLMISVDLWVSKLFSSWITILKKNTLKAGHKEELLLLEQGQPIRMTRIISAKESPVKTPGVKELFSLDSTEFIQGMHLYDLEQMKKQKRMDSLWEKDRLRDNHSLPSYYDLSLIVRDELHDSILEPFTSFLALLGIGHFFTPTGRYYWKVVLNNYKIFLCVCLGIWTDEAVEAYGLEEKSVNLSVDGRAFLYKSPSVACEDQDNEEGKANNKSNNNRVSLNSVVPLSLSRSAPSRRQILGITFTQSVKIGVDQLTDQNTPVVQNRSESEKQNIREVLPAVISVLICSRVILFQIVPSLVLFATVSMTLASFPLFIFNDFLIETLPALIIYGAINREMAIERELKSFVALHPETKEVLSEADTIQVLCGNYSWRLSVRGIILFWNESRLLQFIQSSLTLFFSFLLLIYTRKLLMYLIVILGVLLLFIITKSLVFLLYLGSSLDLKDSDFPSWLQWNHIQRSTAVVPDVSPSVSEPVAVVAEQKDIEEDEENINNQFTTHHADEFAIQKEKADELEMVPIVP